MKRYLAFHGDKYYASEAMGDFIGDFDTLEEAARVIMEAEEKARRDYDHWEFKWGIVYDIELRKNVWYNGKPE